MGEAVRASVKAPETKKEHQVSQVQKGYFYQPVSSPVEQILFLQRTIGNQAVGKIIKSGVLQAKLMIGQPGDVYEQEADRVAEHVMRIAEPKEISGKTPDNPVQVSTSKGVSIQRAAAPTLRQRLAQAPSRTAYYLHQQFLEQTGAIESNISEYEEWLQDNLEYLADEAEQYLWQRLIQVYTGGLPSNVLAQTGDEEWAQRTIEMLTGLSYISAHELYGGPDEWRRLYAATGQYPGVAVCDQLGELIQHIRGLRGYGGGLTAHYEYYLRNGGFTSSSPETVQPGSTIFHIVDSGTNSVLDIPPHARVPIVGQWDSQLVRELRQQENQYLRQQRELRRRPQTGESGVSEPETTDQDERERLSDALAEIYYPARKIQHENTVIRTTTRNGRTMIQVFDFMNHVAQEGDRWISASSYINADRHTAYLPTGRINYLSAPRGEAYITIKHRGSLLSRLDVCHLASDEQEQTCQGASLLPTSHYLWVLSGAPFTDELDIALDVYVGQRNILHVSESGGSILSMERPGGEQSPGRYRGRSR